MNAPKFIGKKYRTGLKRERINLWKTRRALRTISSSLFAFFPFPLFAPIFFSVVSSLLASHSPPLLPSAWWHRHLACAKPSTLRSDAPDHATALIEPPPCQLCLFFFPFYLFVPGPRYLLSRSLPFTLAYHLPTPGSACSAP